MRVEQITVLRVVRTGVTGVTTSTDVVIVSGLKVGDQVLLHD